MDGMRGLDAWITGGRYSSSAIRVTCPECEHETPVHTETEYGQTTWMPEECEKCHREFQGDETSETDEGPDYEPDDWREPPDEWGI